MLRHEDFSDSIIVDSSRPIVFSHAAASWIIKDDHFVRREISSNSKKIDKIISNWLDKYELSPTPNYGIIFGDTERYRVYNTVQKDNIMF